MEFKKEGPSNLHSRMMRNFRMVSFWVKRRISYFSFQKNIKKLDPSLRSGWQMAIQCNGTILQLAKNLILLLNLSSIKRLS